MDVAEALGLGDSELVAFVGAGGKKTTMGHLVEAGEERGLSVGYTTTTHTPPPDSIPLVLSAPGGLVARLADRSSPVAFASDRVSDPERVMEKVRGFEPEVLSDLFESSRPDWLLVKADGARRREFKAPGAGEPVVPSATTHVVALASVRAVGQPLDAPVAHRPERIAAIPGVETGVSETITAETVGRVLASPGGGLKNVPRGARVTPVINKADTPELRDRAGEAIEEALGRSERLDRGLVTSFETGYCDLRTR